jgi:hypothetical protein
MEKFCHKCEGMANHNGCTREGCPLAPEKVVEAPAKQEKVKAEK